MKPTFNIDIASDIVCPWCYIGKRRLEKAIAQLADEFNFKISYHPFELNPELPLNGVDQKQYLTKRFGSESKYHQLTNHTTKVALGDGLLFNFDKQLVMPNTRKAHSIVLAAREYDKQDEVIESFYKGYFTDGVDLSRDETLIRLATAAGLPEDKVRETLSDDSGLMDVEMTEKQLRQMGVHAVPFFILNERYALSGAQPAEVFVNAIKDLGKTLIQEGASCTTNDYCEPSENT